MSGTLGASNFAATHLPTLSILHNAPTNPLNATDLNNALCKYKISSFSTPQGANKVLANELALNEALQLRELQSSYKRLSS
jgi:hypothetical protein